MKDHFLTGKELDKESRRDNFPKYIGRTLSDGRLCLVSVSKAHMLSYHTLLHLTRGLTHKEFHSFINLILIALLLYVIGKVTIS